MDFRTDILPLKNVLYRLALRITLNHQEAEDVVQDTMLKVWNRRENWNSIDSIESYAMTICRNLALDHMKRASSRNLSLENMVIDQADSAANPLELMQSNERIELLHLIINALPEKQKTCMQLRDFEGKSYKEIAEVLDITEEQVKINIFRARKAVKEKF